MGQVNQSNKGLYRLLNFAFVYNTWQFLVGGPRSRATTARKYIKAKPHERVLDIGCGTGNYFELLDKDVDYVGYDISEKYIAFAKNKYKDVPNAKFYCASVEEINALDQDEKFDVAIAIGLLHHLSDEDSLKVIEFAHRFLKEGGRLILCEPAWIPNQSFSAKFWLRMDRGKQIRNVDQYLAFLAKYFNKYEYTIDEKLYRIKFTSCIMEAIR